MAACLPPTATLMVCAGDTAAAAPTTSSPSPLACAGVTKSGCSKEESRRMGYPSLLPPHTHPFSAAFTDASCESSCRPPPLSFPPSLGEQAETLFGAWFSSECRSKFWRVHERREGPHTRTDTAISWSTPSVCPHPTLAPSKCSEGSVHEGRACPCCPLCAPALQSRHECAGPSESSPEELRRRKGE